VTDLPPGWRKARLGEIAEISTGLTPATSQGAYYGGGIPFVKPPDLMDRPVAATAQALTELGAAQVRTVPGDTVLVSCIGVLGKTAITTRDVAFNQQINAVVFGRDVVPKYGFYACQTLRPYLESVASATTISIVNKTKFSNAPIPVAPIREQYRIVAEIEKHFTRLDASVAALNRLQVHLRRYRAAVLKAACEGRLVVRDVTAPREGGREFERGTELVQRILAERRGAWLATKLARRYEDPAEPNTAALPRLPEGWAWATAEQVSDASRAITYGVIKLGDPVEDGVPTLRSSDVRHLRLDLTGVKRIAPVIAANYRRTFLTGGEVLVTVRGTLGGVVVAPSRCRGFNVSREVAVIALVDSRIGPCVALFIASPFVQAWLKRRAKGVAYTGINIETLRQMPIPIPPLSEQRRIVTEAESNLSEIEALEATVAASLTRAAKLRSAILRAAFDGRLFPAPTDHALAVAR